MIRERLQKLVRVHRLKHEPIHLTHRQIYILPTGYGWIFALLVIVMLIGAVNYANNLIFMVTFLLAGIGLNAIVQTHSNLSGLTVDVQAPTDRYADQLGTANVTVQSGDRERFGIELRFNAVNTLIDLTRAEKKAIPLQLAEQTRGQHQMPRLTLQTRYPLGLFRAWTHIQAEHPMWIYPQSKALLPLPAQQAVGDTDLVEGKRKSEKGTSIDNVREYYPGDSVRRIDWRALARGRGLLSKTGDDQTEGAQELWLEWQATKSLQLEDRLSVIAAWIRETNRLGIEAGLRMPGAQFTPSRDEQQQKDKLRYLAAYG